MGKIWGQYKILICTILGVLFLLAVYIIGLPELIHEYEQRGAFGDMFGGLNTLFSGLAFAFLIYTVFLQGKQLEMQREELRLQRKELEDTRAELARSAKSSEFIARVNKLQAQAMANQSLIDIEIALKQNSAPKEKEQTLRPLQKKAESLWEDLAKIEDGPQN